MLENRGLSDFFKKDDLNNPFSRSTSQEYLGGMKNEFISPMA
jgi:hypothetical protein